MACTPAAEPPVAISFSVPGTALLSALGLADRLVDADDASGPPPRIALVPPRLRDGAQRVAALRAGGARRVRVDPRGFEGVFALARRIGEALEGRDRAEAWIRDTRTALAAISASSLGEARPHVAAVVSLDPLRIAGGSSLETELLEIAGAESVTHGGARHRVALAGIPEEHREPDLWLVFSAAPADAPQRIRASQALPVGASIAFFAWPDDWLADPVGVAARLRARVAGLGAVNRPDG